MAKTAACTHPPDKRKTVASFQHPDGHTTFVTVLCAVCGAERHEARGRFVSEGRWRL